MYTKTFFPWELKIKMLTTSFEKAFIRFLKR